MHNSLSSFIVILRENFLGCGQLFLGQFSYGVIFVRKFSPPIMSRGGIVRGRFSFGAIILGGSCAGANYPQGNHPGGNCSGGTFPRGSLFQDLYFGISIVLLLWRQKLKYRLFSNHLFQRVQEDSGWRDFRVLINIYQKTMSFSYRME